MSPALDAVQELQFSQRVPIQSVLGRPDKGGGLAGQKVRIGGWVKTGGQADNGAFAFLEVNDGSCLENLQVIVGADVYELSDVVSTGTCVHVEGLLKPQAQGVKQSTIELEVEKVIDVGTVDAAKYPLPKTEMTLEFLRDVVHLRPRTNTISAVARIRNALAYATHTFFQEHGFLYVHTPIITTTDCEGAWETFQVTTVSNENLSKLDERCKPAERFKLGGGVLPKKDGKIGYLDDFFARQAFLNVSGQLQVETYACALSSVYTFGPTFRPENHHTTRHLAEFWMVEPEIAFADIEDDMNCAEAYVRFLCRWLLDHCYDDMEFMAKFIDETALQRLEMVVKTKFPRISYTEAVVILEEAAKVKKFENKVEWGVDLASEHERYLAEEVFKSPVIVYNYPKKVKPYYMKVNDDNITVAAMDVLVPKVGELIGGSQREDDYEVLKERMLETGLPVEPYQWYLDLRRYGTVKHSGFGLGFERMILFATGIENIRDVIPFPRYPGRADL